MEDIGELYRTFSAEHTLLQWIYGGQISRMIYVIAELKIPDLLAGGARDCEWLAVRTDTHAPSLYRLLRALARIGIFREEPAGHFCLTDLSRLLTAEAPDSLLFFALSAGAPAFWPVHGSLIHSIRTGKPAFEHVHKLPFFRYLEQYPAVADVFDAQMRVSALQEAASLLAGYDFSFVRVLVDAGGGEGGLLAAVLKQYNTMNGVLFDRQCVLGRARRYLEKQGVLSRCRLEPGNFFHSLPADGDLYILKRVLHDWDDLQAGRILSCCRSHISGSSRLLIIEYLTGSEQGDAFAALADISMLILTGGRERTQDEYRQLLAKAGFSITKVVGLDTGLSVIEAIPAG